MASPHGHGYPPSPQQMFYQQQQQQAVAAAAAAAAAAQQQQHQVTFSGKHNGLYLYFSRLVRPVWLKTLVVPAKGGATGAIDRYLLVYYYGNYVVYYH